jgi:hypothetical protein
MIGRPRANATAYRIIAAPYVGILYDDQFWTDEEWYRQEARRRTWRKAAQRKRLSSPEPVEPGE